jgi:ribosomal protein L11 methyltransferase
MQTETNHVISPSWVLVKPGVPYDGDRIPLILGPGGGWGDGTHTTTGLCLHAIGVFRPRMPIRALDFGSGSGLLSIALARLGASVDAVDIDAAALSHGQVNARLNDVESQVRFFEAIDESRGPYDLIVANISREVLLKWSGAIVRTLRPGGTLIFSGLMMTDTPDLSVRYFDELGRREPQVHRRGDWCCMVWRDHA